MAGRKPLGPQLVHHLDGSEHAKDRMEVILETIAGKLSIREACDRLGIEEAMFFRIRMGALQAAVSRLEPRPTGRPPRVITPEGERITNLEQELQNKDLELKATAVRLEIAQAMPQLIEDEAGKKTTDRKQRRRHLRQRKRRRGKRPR